MNTQSLIPLVLLLIAILSAGLSYAIMRLTYHPKCHASLTEKFDGMNIAGLNSGAVILLSLGLAFVFNDIADVHNRVKTAVLQEADALRTLGRATLNLDPSIGIPLMKATREYTEAVLHKEWPELKSGRSTEIRNGHHSALEPLAVMSDIVYSPETHAKVSNTTSMQLNVLVSRIREHRLLRIDTSGFTIGRRGLLLAALTLLASSTILSLAMLRKKSIQLMSNFFLFWVTVSAMYLAFAAQNPFDGLDLVSNAPLQEALERLQAMHIGHSK